MKRPQMLLILFFALALFPLAKRAGQGQEASPPAPSAVEAKAGPLDPSQLSPHQARYAHEGLGPEGLAAVALMHEERGEFEQALAVLAQAIARYPEHASLYAIRGALWMRLEEYAHALTDLDRAVELGADAGALVNRALVYRQFNRDEDALQDLNQAIERAPDLVAAWFNRGVLHFERGENEQAPAPYFNRAVTYWNLNEAERAIADMQRFIEIAQNPAWKAQGQAVLEAWLGEGGEAGE